MTNSDNDKKRKRRYVIILSILLILILILLLFCRFGRIYNPGLVPTGNVDVFDIDIYCNHRIKTADNTEDENEYYDENENETASTNKNSRRSNSNKANTNTNSNSSQSPVNNEENNGSNTNNGNNENGNNENGNNGEEINTDDEEFAGIRFDENGRTLTVYNEERDKSTMGVSFINQEDGNYIFQERLNIFSNAAYQYTTKVAPGVSNTYHFVVHNSNDLDVRYYMEMYEESEYRVNLKYRLKNNDGYVIGSDTQWVTANELRTSFKDLNKGISDNYSLEWKWFDDDNNDNLAGKNMESEYKLNIRFYIESKGN